MIKVDAMGDTCPIPVVKTKNAIKELKGSGEVQTLVDNEIAVQNLTKMANQKGYGVRSQKLGEGKYEVIMTISDGNADAIVTTGDSVEEEQIVCYPDARKKNTVVVLASATMGAGDEELGEILMKGFIYALSQQEELPTTILLYNGGAKISCEESPSLEDLRSLEAQGVEILTCGTCLNHYGLTDKLKVGDVTNMYVIAEKMTQADLIVKP
ncbi:sulfurtransferase-like selenium metabolism protein YedF [uncultured Eubacterium sp.]|uniref:sulfurtransferase-like selenium metabolism protein YedF n=1 Tax=uncultured Eubacterium sp. TaxID=165185 RepID=UPI00259381F3|nr:sulfurtransferase-like selenium metabolism protein YedF [uncultured Eubacterium sp.]